MSIDGNKLIEERFLTMTFPVLIYLHSEKYRPLLAG